MNSYIPSTKTKSILKYFERICRVVYDAWRHEATCSDYRSARARAWPEAGGWEMIFPTGWAGLANVRQFFQRAGPENEKRFFQRAVPAIERWFLRRAGKWKEIFPTGRARPGSKKSARADLYHTQHGETFLPLVFLERTHQNKQNYWSNLASVII